VGGVGEVVIGLDGSVNMRSKIISHNFIKGKISLSPMEMILIIPKCLEYLEGLVKSTRKKKVLQNNQMTTIVIFVITL
jgi:hypothetical protein